MLNSFDLSSYDSESTKIHTKVVVDVPKDGGVGFGLELMNFGSCSARGQII